MSLPSYPSRTASRPRYQRCGGAPFVLNLPGLGFAIQSKRKQRIVFVFSPNGIVPKNFWPDEEAPT